jgi:hypothetical protein
MTEQFLLDAAREFLEPVGKRSAYTASRLAVMPDGSTEPVLLLLAKQKFGTWAENQFPFWIDGDLRNEVLSNVDLATRPARKESVRPIKNRFGAPAGSREYMQRWREANRESVRASQRRYAARRKVVLQKITEAVVDGDPLLGKLAELAKIAEKEE